MKASRSATYQAVTQVKVLSPVMGNRHRGRRFIPSAEGSMSRDEIWDLHKNRVTNQLTNHMKVIKNFTSDYNKRLSGLHVAIADLGANYLQNR